VLWAVLDALQQRNDAQLLQTQIRERLIFKKSLPVPMRAGAVWTRSAPRRARRRPWYVTVTYVGLVALVIAAARVTDADAQLLDLVLDGVRTLGTYLAE
jgi:hypothetical protein